MSQGKIKSVTPQLINGVHKAWVNKYTGNTNYGYIVVFEDNTTGICGSEKTVYPLPIGTEVTYDVTKSNSGSNNITKIKRLEFAMPEYPAANGKNGNGNGNSYNNPSTVKKIGFSMCQNVAMLFFTGTGRKPRNLDDLNGLAGVFYNWIVEDTLETDSHYRDKVTRRCHSLRLAADCIQLPGLEITSKEQVMQAAETFLQPLSVFDDDSQF